MSEACLDCGRYVSWFLDSITGDAAQRIRLWKVVSDDNKHYYLCPTCFIIRANKLGIEESRLPWRLTPFCDPEMEGRHAKYPTTQFLHDRWRRTRSLPSGVGLAWQTRRNILGGGIIMRRG
jgi:hypothetical protein